MKQILLFAMAIATTLFSFAGDEKPLVISAGQLTNIEVGSNMKVVLVNAKSLSAQKSTSLIDASQKLYISISGGTLHLDARNLRLNEKVNVVVDNIESLTLGNNTVVETDNYIDGKKIKVNVGDESFVRLVTPGSVDAFGSDGLAIDVQTRPLVSPKTKVAIF